ncbi:MAG: NAD-dependent epimerase/dehydratase family protein [Gammaproteobacteria bacterium]
MKPEVIATPDANAGRREMASQVDGKPAVLVTGSTGLIGSKIIEAFAGDYRVIGLDVKRPQEQVAGAEWIECDVTRDESVVRSLAAVRERYSDRLASVIHLAAYYDFSGEPSPLYRTLTVEGTRRLLQALQQFKVEQFVFSSTLLVMKPAEEDEVITERSVTESEEETWDYPRSKIEAERVIRQERGAIPTVILRIAGVYDDNCRSIPIAQQISRIYEKRLESHFFPGDASHGQAFVHLNDLVDCFRKVVDLRRELEPHELFLVAEPDVMSYADLQDQIGELIHQQEWATIRVPKVIAKAGAWVQEKMAGEEETFIKPWMVDLADAHYPVEIERARQILGWEPRHLLRNTLSRMIGDLKTDPLQWYQKNKLKWQEDEQQKPAGKK